MRAYPRSRRRAILALGLAASIVLTTTLAWAGAPTDQLRSSVDQVIRILHGPAPTGAARRAALLRAIEPRFAPDGKRIVFHLGPIESASSSSRSSATCCSGRTSVGSKPTRASGSIMSANRWMATMPRSGRGS